jgi:hypothetical protein
MHDERNLECDAHLTGVPREIAGVGQEETAGLGLCEGWSQGWNSVVKEARDSRVSADRALVILISPAPV